MTKVLHVFCLLVTSSGVFALPQYNNELGHPLPAQPELHQPPQTVLNYPPSDEEAVASLKRNYQAAFANVASQMAAHSRLFTPVEEARSALPTGETITLRTNQNLYHRNAVPNVQTGTTLFTPVHQNRRASLSFSLSPAPNVHPQLITSQPHGNYIYNNADSVQSLRRPKSGQQEPLGAVILPNGFLADTPEVEAAKREHLAAVARARAAVVRSESRRKEYAVQYHPAQKRVSTNQFPVYKTQHFYELL